MNWVTRMRLGRPRRAKTEGMNTRPIPPNYGREDWRLIAPIPEESPKDIILGGTVLVLGFLVIIALGVIKGVLK